MAQVVGTQVEIIWLNPDISTKEETLSELNRRGFRPADLLELRAYQEKDPDIPINKKVVALGTVQMNRSGVATAPYLIRHDTWKGPGKLEIFYTRLHTRELREDCLYAVVRK